MSDPVLEGIKNTLTLQAMSEFWASSDDVGEGVAGMRIARESENGILAVYRSTDDYNFDDGTGSAALLIDVDGNVTLTDASLELTGIGHIALGSPPPTSASAGTGIWIDDTGVFGLNANTQEFYLQASDGKAYAGGGNVIIDANGVSFAIGAGVSNQANWTYGGNNVFQIGGSYDAGPPTRIAVTLTASKGTASVTTIDLKAQKSDGTYATLSIDGNNDRIYTDRLVTLNNALKWATDNTYDIGASGANRPRSAYLGSKLYFLSERAQATGLYDIANSDTTIGNVATEQTLYSKSVTANDLGTTGGLRLRLLGQWTNNTGATRTLTVRLKFGATTLVASALSLTTSGTNGQYEILLNLFNTSASAQREVSQINFMRAGALADSAWAVALTSAENTTSAKTLAVTMQWDSASANATLTNKLATLEVLP